MSVSPVSSIGAMANERRIAVDWIKGVDPLDVLNLSILRTGRALATGFPLRAGRSQTLI